MNLRLNKKAKIAVIKTVITKLTRVKSSRAYKVASLWIMLTIIVTTVAFIAVTNVQGRTITPFGNTAIGTHQAHNDANVQSISYFRSNKTGTVTEIVAYVTANSSGKAMAALYDSSKSEKTLLQQSNSEMVGTQSSWIAFKLPSGYTVTEGATYGLAITGNVPLKLVEVNGTGQRDYSATNTYSKGFPEEFSTINGTDDKGAMSIYAVGTAAEAGTATPTPNLASLPPTSGTAALAPTAYPTPTVTSSPILTPNPTALPTNAPLAIMANPTPTPQPTPVPTPTSTPTPTPTPTPVPTPVSTPTPTPTPSPTPVPTPTATPSPTPQPTPVPTPTPTPTPTPPPALPNLDSIPSGWGTYENSPTPSFTGNVHFDYNLMYGGLPSIRLDSSPLGTNTAREADGIYLNVKPGQHIVFSCWIRTSDSSYGDISQQSGGRIGFDYYGASGRLSGIQYSGSYTQSPSDQILAAQYVHWGTATWTLRTIETTVPNIVYSDSDGSGQTPVGIIPTMQVWSTIYGASDLGQVWFGNPTVTIQ